MHGLKIENEAQMQIHQKHGTLALSVPQILITEAEMCIPMITNDDKLSVQIHGLWIKR
jgi:hypothetical protein